MRRARLHALVLAPWLGCAPAVGTGEGAARDEPGPDDAVEARSPKPEGGPFEVELDVEGIVPAAAVTPPAGPGHAERVGWTHQGRFAYCRVVSADCTECRLLSRDGTVEALESGSGCDEGLPPDELRARLLAERIGPGAERWAWGDELIMVVQTRQVEQGYAGQSRPLLEVGARRRDGSPPGWLLHVDPCQGCGLDQVCVGAAHLDALTLSPDGGEVVALVHLRSNDGTEELRLERLPTRRLADAAQVPARVE